MEMAIAVHGLGPFPFGGAFVANRLTQLVAAHDVTCVLGGLILMDCDVAASVCHALGVQTSWLGGDVVPTMLWGDLSRGSVPDLPVVTKFGSFGLDDAL